MGHEEQPPQAGALLTPEQAARLLAVPRSWVYAEARAGRMPHVRVGRYVRFRHELLTAWIGELERGPTPYRRYHSGSDPDGRRLG
jgi:excisionase family DNA binding protein